MAVVALTQLTHVPHLVTKLEWQDDMGWSGAVDLLNNILGPAGSMCRAWVFLALTGA